jgi:hypothetical protein
MMNLKGILIGQSQNTCFAQAMYTVERLKMSNVMLFGVLRMPPELWRSDPVDEAQRHGRYLQAADRIFELETAIEKTLDENDHLADGDNCTLIHLVNVMAN